VFGVQETLVEDFRGGVIILSEFSIVFFLQAFIGKPVPFRLKTS